MSRQPLAKSSPALLSSWLTPAHLQELVEARVYALGEGLADSGRVTTWSETPVELEGEVRGPGRALHDVMLSVDEGGLDGDCSCERYLLSGFCEHLVALGLVWSRARGSESSPAASASPPPALEKEDVRAWLESHRVAHLGRVPVMEVRPFLPSSPEWLTLLFRMASHPLVSLLEGSSRLPSSVSASQRAGLERAAWARVQAELESVRRGLEGEALTPESLPPTDARLGPLVQALGRLRARVRERTVPRELPARMLPLVFEESPPAAVVYEFPPGETPRDVREDPPAQAVKLDLKRLLAGEAAVRCSRCDPVGPACCAHALSAVERVLGALGEARRAETNARLAEQLFVEPGRRLLEALDQARLLSEARPTPASGAQVGFRLEGAESGSPRLRAWLQRPSKRGGLTRGAVVSPRDTAEARAVLTSAEEAQALDLCLLMDRQYGAADRHPLLLQALRLLAHSHRLVLDSRRDVPLRVRAVPLGFSLREADSGGGEELWVQPSVEGVPVLEWARDRLRDHSLTPWVFVREGEPELVLVSVSPAAMAVLHTLVEHGGWLPPAWRTELLDRLGGVESAFPLSLPPSLEGREVPAEPGLLLRLRPTGGEVLEGPWWVRPLTGARPRVPGEGGELVRGARAGERVWTRRDLEGERARVAEA
ncbi:MAG: ATP-dependent helicase, partial [Cystobacter sp.]